MILYGPYRYLEMFFGLGQILGLPGGPPQDPDAPQGPRPEVQKGSPVNLMNWGMWDINSTQISARKMNTPKF